MTTTTQDLERTVQGYLECALWSSTFPDSDAGDPLDDVYSVDAFDADARREATETCRSFLAANADLLELAGRPADHVGHDLWLTRNWHGAGFWDRGLGAVGDALTDAAHAYGEAYVFPVDGDTLTIDA